jgi:hypothetical protein
MALHLGFRGPGHLARVGGAGTDPTLALSMGLASNGSFLDSISGSSSLVTFSRASSGTHYNSSGVLTTAATDAARFNYNPNTLAARGLLIEPQRTNICVRSATFSNASWTKQEGSVGSSTTGPDGAASAVEFVENAATAAHTFIQSITKAGSAIQYTGSAYVKPRGRTYLYFAVDGGAAAQRGYCHFNLSGDGSIETAAGVSGSFASPSATITKVGSFYRVTLTVTTDTAVTVRVLAAAADATAATNLLPTLVGSSAAAFEIFGAQLEAGAFATSYIATAAAAVTRSADIATMTGASFSDWYNASTGTFVAEFDVLGASGTLPIISADDNTANEKIELYGSSTNPMVTITDGGVSQANLDVGTIAADTDYTIGLSYAVNDVAACLDAGTVGTDTSATMPAPDRLRLGADQAGNYLGGHLKSLYFYDEAKADAALQTLTA